MSADRERYAVPARIALWLERTAGVTFVGMVPNPTDPDGIGWYLYEIASYETEKIARVRSLGGRHIEEGTSA